MFSFSTGLDPRFQAMALCCKAERTSADRERLAALLSSVGESQFWETASENGLVAHVAHALLETLPRGQTPSRWIAFHDEVKSRIGGYLAEADALADELHTQGIRVVGLKNVGISRGIFHCTGCSPMGDVDLLVSRKHVRAATEALARKGFVPANRRYGPLKSAEAYDEEFASGGVEMVRGFGSPSALWIEVQWRAVAGRWIRPDQEPPTDVLLERSRPIPGTALRMLAPVDNLLQVCLHTAKHTYLRAPGFRLHTDVDRIVRGTAIDWDAFCDTVERLGVTVPVWLSLKIPSDLLSTPVPPSVLRRLGRHTARLGILSRWLSRKNLFNYEERKFSTPEYVAFYAILYDSSLGLARGIFPETEWMKARYGFDNSLLLGWYYPARVADLLIKRWF